MACFSADHKTHLFKSHPFQLDTLSAHYGARSSALRNFDRLHLFFPFTHRITWVLWQEVLIEKVGSPTNLLGLPKIKTDAGTMIEKKKDHPQKQGTFLVLSILISRLHTEVGIFRKDEKALLFELWAWFHILQFHDLTPQYLNFS